MPLPHGGEVLVIGCIGAGKTMLMRRLETASSGHVAKELPAPQPTVGTELLELTHRRCVFALREMGGAMMPLWPRYFAVCRSLIFVADTSSDTAVAAAVLEWHNALGDKALFGKPVLLVLNHRDRDTALPEEEVRQLFRLADLEATGRTFTVCWTSAARGTGVDAVLEWCAEAALFAAAGSPASVAV